MPRTDEPMLVSDPNTLCNQYRNFIDAPSRRSAPGDES
jgi:hypothetical protein